jgi:transcriptional regulator with PAS, ATPase and Fis domain
VLKKLEHHLTNIIEKYLKTEEIGNTEESIAVEKPIQSVLSGDFDFISEDKKMIHILRQAKRQAESDAAVMIYGETGVGKEVLARWIHQNSKRSGQPFVIVDLTTIPENLVESELFGHEKGSFTGAYRQKIGRIELAHKGTLFIDEIGEVNKDLQVKLLRLIQEKTFVRIGGIKSLVSDFRLIAASSRNLAKEVEAGRFREDLYYRLNVLELNMPPLRERRDDILPIARYYISYYEKKYNRLLNPIQNEQEKYLTEYNWPGNVRELKNVIERAIIIAENNYLEFDFSIKKAESEQNPFSGFPTLDEIQRRYIKYVLSRTRGRIGGTGGAAEILGMKRTSVNSRIKKLGLVTD